MKNTFKLFSVAALVSVIVFSMTACASSSSGSKSKSDGVAKTLVVTGIDGFSGDVLVTLADNPKNLTGSMVAVGGSALANKNLSVPLVNPKNETQRWTGLGEYFVVLVFEQKGKVIYFYSAGGMTALRYNFKDATTTIPFALFRKL